MTTASDKNPHHLRILSAAEINDLYARPQFTEDEMAFRLNLMPRSNYSYHRLIDGAKK